MPTGYAELKHARSTYPDHDRPVHDTAPNDVRVELASYDAGDEPPPTVRAAEASPQPLVPSESLADLERIAEARNPTLLRLRREANAACAKAEYVDKLPDPTVAGSVFAQPIETAAGSQRANVTVMQMLPWLARLDAQARQACCQAIALQNVYAAERLNVIGDVRAMWYRLYVIGKQIEINRANQEVLKSLLDVANARVATGKATQGDVLAGTLEYSALESKLVTLRQQRVAVKADLNRLMGRNAEVPIQAPIELQATLPAWDHAMLRQLAWQNQPAIATAQLQTQAARWGIEIARLRRRPDLSLSASWFAMDDNRPPSAVVDVGQDAWSVGAMVSVPLWRNKYDAMQREANWKHAAAHASVEETRQRYDAALRDLWEQARAADETARLYQQTILPQAMSTLKADQQSYGNLSVEFDRVLRDFRNLVTLELGYHRALGQLATALARIRQATGTELAP